MKFQISSWAFAFVLSLALSGISSPTFASYHSAYSSSGKFSYTNPRWMAEIYDNVKLSALSIPGTNASASRGKGGDAFETQSMDIDTQLRAGIRYFDFGCFKENTHDKSLYLYYGWIYLGYDLTHPLTAFKKFLEENPSETIIMYVSQEHSKHNDDVFYDCLNEYIKNFSKYIFHGDDYSSMDFNPSLGEVRGKIVLLLPYSQSEKVVRPLHGPFDMKPPAYLHTNWDLYEQWINSKEFINAHNSRDISRLQKPSILYIGANGGVFPYFVASGHTSSSEYAYQLSTGYVSPLFNYYPDFPRTSCFDNLCTISFKGLNMLITDFISNNYNLSSVGIIAANFPGPGFIDSIIATNRLFAKAPRIIGKYFKIVPVSGTGHAIDIDYTNNEVILWEFHGGKNQQWYFELVDNDSYLIRSIRNENLLLSVKSLNVRFDPVVIRPYKEGDKLQIWTLQLHSDNHFVLKGAGGLLLHHTPGLIQNHFVVFTKAISGQPSKNAFFFINPTPIL